MKNLQYWLGWIGVRLIRIIIKIGGKSVAIKDAPWLEGMIGPEGEIGDKPYQMLAKKEGLSLVQSPKGALVKDFDQLNSPSFDVNFCDPKVRHFYENTALYDMDVWSESRFPGRLFLWLIVNTVSRYMNQLNFPVLGLEMSKGMSSEIISLQDSTGKTMHTGWYRRLKENGRVIYTGFYSTVNPPELNGACIKVVFPLPKGNATVILKPYLDEKNRFVLVSDGKKFGEQGFYRIVSQRRDHYKVMQLKRLKEKFTVYTDPEGVLRCDHSVHFWGMVMLRLHYRMNLKKKPKPTNPNKQTI
ncbi:MAG: hypothetical protein AAFY71_25240 [Bacteroidota bacterium]